MSLKSWQSLSRILVSHPGDIQDMARLTAAMRQLQRVVPQAHVTVLCRLDASRIALSLPGVMEVLVHRALSERGLTGDRELLLDLIEVLRSEQFEAAILFPDDRKSPYPLGYVCYLAGIPMRVGLSREFGGGVLSHPVNQKDHGSENFAELSTSQRNLAFLNAVGLVEGA